MGTWDIAVFAACCVVGSAVQSISSFGFAVVLVALLPVFGVAIRDAVVLVTLLVVPNIAVAVWQVRREASLQRVAWVLLGVPIGTPLGIWLLAFGPVWVLRGLLGVVLVGAAAMPFLRGEGPARPARRLWAFVAGVASGALGAALSTGGPPIVLYFRHRQLSKEAIKASVMLAFVGTVAWRLVAYVAQAPLTGEKLLTASLAWKGMAFWPAVIAGTLLGEWVFARLSLGGFRWAVAAMLVVCGIYQIGKAAGVW
ncbi:MAG: sulfite exporter TauE/SafE family protein [Planctomycetes bacterium]|nr:sulfite exporter TauE/SafE family protein [Planctomycetota bacterium]